MSKFFIEQSIFNNYSANNFCDEIISLIQEESETFPRDFALTGRAAYELQRPTNTDLKNLIFITWNLDYYLKLATQLDRYNVKNFLKYKEKLMFRYLAGNINLCVEIHYSEKPQSIVSHNNITMIDLHAIPNELLV